MGTGRDAEEYQEPGRRLTVSRLQLLRERLDQADTALRYAPRAEEDGWLVAYVSDVSELLAYIERQAHVGVG